MNAIMLEKYTIIRNDHSTSILDENNNETYYEHENGYWIKRVFDDQNRKVYFENSRGFTSEWEYVTDKWFNINAMFYSDSNGFKSETQYDNKDRVTIYRHKDYARMYKYDHNGKQILYYKEG